MTMNWSRYIGIPYRPGGIDAQGSDCWGLVRHVMQTEMGIDPGRFATDPRDMTGIARTVAAEQSAGRWTQIAEGAEEAFDIAVINRVARIGTRLTWGPFHIGIITDAAHVLHVDEMTSAIRLCFRDHGLNRRHSSWGGQRFEIWRLRQEITAGPA